MFFTLDQRPAAAAAHLTCTPESCSHSCSHSCRDKAHAAVGGFAEWNHHGRCTCRWEETEGTGGHSHLLALQALDRADPSFAARPPLHHRLDKGASGVSRFGHAISF